jgi:imidazolonepropionase-like amidohydrolase
MRNICLPILMALLAACGGGEPPLVSLPAERPAAMLITNVGVLDVKSGSIAGNRDVLISGDRISAIAQHGAISVPAGTQEIAGNGATLLPGLIDMHGHIGNGSAPSWVGELPDPARNLLSYLYSGVTTVLDPADLATQAFRRRQMVAAGELLGPRIYTAGPMVTAHGGHPVAILENLAPWWIRWYLIPRFTRQVDSPETARAAVREIAGLGADVIKVAVDRIPEDAPRLDNAVINAAVDEARAQKLRAVAHIGTTQDAIDAAEAGTALWVHGVYKERIPDEHIHRLAAYRIPMVATMAVFENYALLGQGPRKPTPLERETVPADVLEAFNHVPQTRNLEYFRPYLEKLRPQRAAWRDNVRRLRAAGVTILAGSDTQMGMFPGPGLHRELYLLTEAGMTPAEAIRAATLDAATFLANGQAPEFGVVAEGKVADLLLVEGDPTKDLATLAKIRAVIKGGVPLERRAIAAQ